MVRKASGRIGVGPLLVAGGIGAFASDFSLANLGRTLVIVGVVLYCFQKQREERREQFERLMKSNTTTNEAYDLGHDLGYEEGYQARRDEERPKLVDMNARREEPAWLTSAD